MKAKKTFEKAPKPKLESVLEWAEVDYSDRTRQMVHCPLGHSSGHTASMSVNLEDQLWNCKACDGQGDSWTLIMLKAGCSFIEAVKISQSNSFAAAAEKDEDELPGFAYGRGATRKKAGTGPAKSGPTFTPLWRQ